MSLKRETKKKAKKKITSVLPPKEIGSKIADDPRRDHRARFVEEVLGFLRDLAGKYIKIDSERTRKMFLTINGLEHWWDLEYLDSEIDSERVLKMFLAINDLEHWWNKDLEYFDSKILTIGDKKLVTFFGKVLDSETFEVPSTYLFSGMVSLSLFFNSLSYLKFGIELFIELINDIKYDLENKGAPRELIVEINKDLSKLEELLRKYSDIEKKS